MADKFELRQDIRLDTRVTAALFDEASHRWEVPTDSGERLSARFCIMATGCLSAAQVPDFKGLETFEGKWYHTGPGRTKASISPASASASSAPARPASSPSRTSPEQATHLFVFQRTPNFSIPAHNAPLDAEYERRWKDYAGSRKARDSRVGFVGAP